MSNVLDTDFDKKINAIFGIFSQFLIIDGDLEKHEFERLSIEFGDYIRDFYNGIQSNITIEDVLINLSKNEEEFIKNAEFLNEILSEEEKYAILSAISRLIFSDANINKEENSLFYKLAILWNIPLEV